MLKNFHQKKISGPETTAEYRAEQTDYLIKDWYRQTGGRQTFERKRKAGAAIFLIFILIILMILILVWRDKLPNLFFLNFGKKLGQFSLMADSETEQDMLTLTIEGPFDVSAGSEISYNISWTNNNKAALQDLELTLKYPDNFNFINSSPFIPANSGQNNWALDSLTANETKRLEIKGQILGSRGEEKILSASLTYKPVNFHSKFKQSADYKFLIINSTLSLSLVLPNSLLLSQDLEYEVNYQNTSALDLENVILKIYEPGDFTGKIKELPAGVVLDAEDLSENQETKRLIFTNLPSSEQGKIKIRGEFKSSVLGLAEFRAEIGLQDDKGAFVLQNQAIKIAGIIKPEVELSLNLTNQLKTAQNGLPIFSFGDNAAATVKLHNLSSLNLKNGILTLFIEDEEGLIKNNKINFLTATLNQAGLPADSLITDNSQFKLSQLAPEISRDPNNKYRTQIVWRLTEDFLPAAEAIFKFDFDLIEVPLDIGGDFTIELQGKFSAVSEDVSAPLEWESEPILLLAGKAGR